MLQEVQIKDSPQVVAMLERAQKAIDGMRKTGDKMAAALKQVEAFIEELSRGGPLQDGTLMSLPAREYVAARLYKILNPEPEDCCSPDAEPDEPREAPTHYLRTCEHCGTKWEGFHCPHDGFQNPCPECGRRPETKCSA